MGTAPHLSKKTPKTAFRLLSLLLGRLSWEGWGGGWKGLSPLLAPQHHPPYHTHSAPTLDPTPLPAPSPTLKNKCMGGDKPEK